jgi:DNA-binding MarR family transcriptional regulator
LANSSRSSRAGADPAAHSTTARQRRHVATLDRPANVFGALALIVADQMADAAAAAAGRSESAPAALAALLHFLDRPSVDRLRQVLGLTSSGTVRLLDRLTEAGYVQRDAGADRRSAAVVLTDAGRSAAEDVCQARAAVLDRALASLSPAERASFDELAGKMLVGMMRGPGAVRWMCRLCDTGVCRGSPGGCPVGNAAIQRYASTPADAELPAGADTPACAAATDR